MVKDEFRKLKDVTLKGALTVEAARIIPRVGDPGFLTATSIPGLVGVGITGKIADVSFDLITGKRKLKRRKKR